MKQISILFILLLTTTAFNSSETVALKTFAEDAMKKSLIGNDPIIVTSQVSAKIYSKLDLKHPVFNKLNKEGLFIIEKNSDLTEEFWGEHGKMNGAIVYKEAQEPNPDYKFMRYVFDGKEIQKSTADTIDLNKAKDFIILKTRNTTKYVAFISTKR